MPEPRGRLVARAALRRRPPSTRRYNGSGVERRGSRLLPSAASQEGAPASARTTGYTYRSQLFRGPLTNAHAMDASATTPEGYTKMLE
jgi:hypothetical protein